MVPSAVYYAVLRCRDVAGDEENDNLAHQNLMPINHVEATGRSTATLALEVIVGTRLYFDLWVKY